MPDGRQVHPEYSVVLTAQVEIRVIHFSFFANGFRWRQWSLLDASLG
jgi:hypothetical protein